MSAEDAARRSDAARAADFARGGPLPSAARAAFETLRNFRNTHGDPIFGPDADGPPRVWITSPDDPGPRLSDPADTMPDVEDPCPLCDSLDNVNIGIESVGNMLGATVVGCRACRVRAWGVSARQALDRWAKLSRPARELKTVTAERDALRARLEKHMLGESRAEER